MNAKYEDKSTWATGGGVVAGLGIGFFFLEQSALMFTGSLIAGLGIGLILTALISKSKQHRDRAP